MRVEYLKSVNVEHGLDVVFGIDSGVSQEEGRARASEREVNGRFHVVGRAHVDERILGLVLHGQHGRVEFVVECVVGHQKR